MRSIRAFALVTALAVLVAACGGTAGDDTTTTTTGAAVDETTTTTGAGGEETTTTTSGEDPATMGFVSSDVERQVPDVPDEDLSAVAVGNRGFSVALYGLLADGDGNIVFSPVSIWLALAMAYVGAAGNTADQMAKVLNFDLPPERLHAAMNALDQALESRNHEEPPGPDGIERKVFVEIANSLWGQDGVAFLDAFLDTLAENYGAGMHLVDFVTATEEARVAINGWVAEQTNDLITDLIPQGALSALTRLVLVNAVYLDATWMTTFDPELTEDGAFTSLAGEKVTADMMHGAEWGLPYGSGDGWKVVELPYVGGELAMMIIVPDEDRFAEVEARLAAGLLEEAREVLGAATVNLWLPKFEFRTQTLLKPLLAELGMTDAFDGTLADFSGMTTEERLLISDVIHEAYIAVDEEGTEAAAATAVVMRATAAPSDVVDLRIDRPFLFALQDRATGAVLFMGRVADPTA
jgi:serpin B